MQSLSFFKNFLGASSAQAMQSLATSIVKLDPETASKADLLTMEQDLDRAGVVISKLRIDLNREIAERDTVAKRYKQLMGAAEVLQGHLKDPASPEEMRASWAASLERLLTQIEGVVPELNREKQDVEQTQALLNDAEAAYKDKANALVAAKGNLERAKHDLQHATIQEDRAKDRANQAAVVAGLRTSNTNGLTTALDAMHQSAEAARERATSADMKADALRGAQVSQDDPNIAAAIRTAEAQEQPSGSLDERLAALKSAA